MEIRDKYEEVLLWTSAGMGYGGKENKLIFASLLNISPTDIEIKKSWETNCMAMGGLQEEG